MNPDRLSDRDSAHDDLLVARFRTSEGSGPVAISPGSTLDTPSGTIAIGPDPDAGLDLLRQPGVERLFDSASGSDSLGDVPETACGPGEEASARKDARDLDIVLDRFSGASRPLTILSYPAHAV